MLPRKSAVILVTVLAIAIPFLPRCMEMKQQNIAALLVSKNVTPMTLPLPDGPVHLRGLKYALGWELENAKGRPFDEELFAELESIAPDTAAGHRLLGQYAVLTVPPELDSAQAHLRLAAGLSTNDPMVWLWRGRADWLAGDYEMAAKHWEKIFGNSFLKRYQLAQSIFGRQLDAGIHILVRLLYVPDLTPDQASMVFESFRVWVWWRSLTYDGAIHMCNEFLRPTEDGRTEHARLPGAANVYAQRALSLFRTKRLPEAQRDINRAREIADTPFVEVVRAEILIAEGDTDRAYAILSALDDESTDGHAWLLAGQLLNGLGYRAEARRAWQNATRSGGDFETTAQRWLRNNP